MAKHNDIGAVGEQLAADFLLSHGYSILCRNWRSHHCEIDIIAEERGTIVFVEVKTRTSSPFADPVAAVSVSKISHLAEAADDFISFLDSSCDFRFDVVSVIIQKHGLPVISHIKDAFLPPLL